MRTHIPVELKHPDCQLNTAPFYQCCCTCIYRVPAQRRWPYWLRRIFYFLERFRVPRVPLHMPGKQWACVHYDLSGVETHWFEHSCGCELHTTKEENEKWEAQKESDRKELAEFRKKAAGLDELAEDKELSMSYLRGEHDEELFTESKRLSEIENPTWNREKDKEVFPKERP